MKFKKKSSPQKPLGQLQPNFCGMILGSPPSKNVSGVPDFQPRWPPSEKQKKGGMKFKKKSSPLKLLSRDQRTQFWKGAIQESFQQNLVDIGSVVSVEKIFFKFLPPFFLICIIGPNRQKFKVHKKSCNFAKQLIIMLTQFKFGHILA